METIATLLFIAGLLVLVIGFSYIAFQAIQDYLEERKH